MANLLTMPQPSEAVFLAMPQPSKASALLSSACATQLHTTSMSLLAISTLAQVLSSDN